jgi:hypothetical protein
MMQTERKITADFVNEKAWDMTDKDTQVFYKDLRFWLVVLMLTAFLVFTLVQFPS